MPEGKNRRLESDIEEGKSGVIEVSENEAQAIREVTRPQLQEDILDGVTGGEDQVEE